LLYKVERMEWIQTKIENILITLLVKFFCFRDRRIISYLARR